jgi:hypothetical protein
MRIYHRNLTFLFIKTGGQVGILFGLPPRLGKISAMGGVEIEKPSAIEDHGPGRWVLLAEDDRLFARLFVKFWEQRFPEIAVVTAASLQAARILLSTQRNSPIVAVLDLNLEDGCSEDLQNMLSCPSILWSASAGERWRSKPNGRNQLVKAMAEIGELGGLDVPSQ